MNPDESMEYGILFNRKGEFHRTNMTKAEAEQWLKEWIEDGGNPDTYSLICRSIGPWQKYSDIILLAREVQRLREQLSELLPYAVAGADSMDFSEPYGAKYLPKESWDSVREQAEMMLTRIHAGEFGSLR